MTDEMRPTAEFCKGLVDLDEIVAAGKDWYICRQNKFTRFDAKGDTGHMSAPRSIPYGKEMAGSAIDTLRDTFAYKKDERGLAAVAAMQAYINEAF